MKYIQLLCLLLLAPALVEAQIDMEDQGFDLKILYEFTYQNDSTSADSRKNLLTQLCIGNEASQFQTVAKFQNDSSLSLAPSNVIFYNYGGINPTNFMIEKKGETIRTYEPLNGVSLSGNNELFYYEQKKDDMRWDIHPDTTMIQELVCQKATIDWGGRNWTAWFAIDLPISDGPYKFCGLPGLIMSISDDNRYFAFDVVVIQKAKQKVLPFDKIRSDIRLIKTTETNFYKERKKLRDNMVEYAILNGDRPNEEQKRAIREMAGKDNNHIERY